MGTTTVVVSCKVCGKKVTAIRQGRARVSAYCAECGQERKRIQSRGRVAEYRQRHPKVIRSLQHKNCDVLFFRIKPFMNHMLVHGSEAFIKQVLIAQLSGDLKVVDVVERDDGDGVVIELELDGSATIYSTPLSQELRETMLPELIKVVGVNCA